MELLHLVDSLHLSGTIWSCPIASHRCTSSVRYIQFLKVAGKPTTARCCKRTGSVKQSPKDCPDQLYGWKVWSSSTMWIRCMWANQYGFAPSHGITASSCLLYTNVQEAGSHATAQQGMLAAIGTQSPKWLRGRKIELKIVPAITDR